MTPDAQILASIPNVRNLMLMQDLANGYWKYESEGLLDVTHIRFFTLKEIKKFFFETGYHLNSLRYGIDSRLADFLNQNYQKGTLDIDLGRMVLKKVGLEELQELCTLQFFCVASLGANHDDVKDYSTKQVVHIGNDYIAWLERLQLGKVEGELFEQRLQEQGGAQRVHIAIYAVGADVGNRLMQTMNSLSKLAYDDVIVTVFSETDLPQGLAVSERFRWASFTGNPLQAINECLLAESDAKWLAFISAGDILVPHALLSMVERAVANGYQMIYSDEDVIV
ncbi:MAG TPA: hypothetical protein VFM46_14080, partial [Pseudomonadales bacterium]|nr:hypothetical protein [Pseudomonadales bacterium]